MNLLTNEARISKNGTIKFGSIKSNFPFRIINPFKGEYNKVFKDKMEDLLDQNNNAILELSFGNDRIYVTTVKGMIISFNTLEDACKVPLMNCFTSEHDWYDNDDKYALKDSIISRVILRGLP